MKIFSDVGLIQNVSYFRAPYDSVLTPFPIPEGFECIEVIVKGGVMYDDGKVDKACKCGSIFWHIGGEQTIYRSVPDNPYECMVFWFKVRKGRARPINRMTFWPDPRGVRDFVWGAFRAYSAGPDENMLSALSVYVYSTLSWHARQYTGFDEGGGVPHVLSNLLEYVENNLGEDLQVCDLTDHANISAPYLYKLFRKHFNTSPHKFILSRKLGYACTLLTSTNSQVKQICVDCGMENPETFCRAFRKAYGMTPLEYRRSGGTNPQ